jgi:NADH-quinone oxidoreductase subunit N
VTLATAPITPIAYPASQAWSDLTQVAPVVVLVLALLLAMILDLVLSPRRSGMTVAVVAALGLAASLGFASYSLHNGGGHSAYYGMATGDSFANLFQILIAILGLLSVVIAHVYVRRRDMLEPELHILMLAAAIGMMALVSATSLVTVFVALEALSIALYVASGYSRRETRSQEAAAKYLLVGGFASAFVLYGMALVYGASGSTVLSTIGSRITSHDANNPLMVAGVVLLAVGFAYKISGAPFHQWTPDVYEGAPLPVTAFMSVGTKAAAFAMIIRVFSTGLGHLADEWALLLAVVAACSMIIGNFAALVQTGVKRLLAYSGVAQAGYILVGVVAGGRSGIGAAVFYLFAYLFMNFGAFAILTFLVTPEREHDRLDDLDGLGYRNRILGLLMTLFMLSLAGFPPLVGFWGKLYLFTAGVASGWTWLVVIALLTSVASVAYYLRVVYHVWLPVGETHRRLFPSYSTLAVVGSAALLVLLLSVFSSFVLGQALLGADTVLAIGH